LAGAAYLLNDNAGVLWCAQREQKSLVDQKPPLEEQARTGQQTRGQPGQASRLLERVKELNSRTWIAETRHGLSG